MIHLPTQETQVQSLGQEDPWRKKWQPTPVILPGKSWGQRSLVGYSPWGLKELDMTERLSTHTESKKKKKKAKQMKYFTILSPECSPRIKAYSTCTEMSIRFHVQLMALWGGVQGPGHNRTVLHKAGVKTGIQHPREYL